MSTTKTVLATLALGATFAFAGPAFAEKMKATLDGKAEVPPNTSAATGVADIDYDPASKKLTWKVTYTGPRISTDPPKPARTPASRWRSRTPPQAPPKAAPR
jgi:hypothetical protein